MTGLAMTVARTTKFVSFRLKKWHRSIIDIEVLISKVWIPNTDFTASVKKKLKRELF